jgi:hypothetical protein
VRRHTTFGAHPLMAGKKGSPTSTSLEGTHSCPNIVCPTPNALNDHVLTRESHICDSSAPALALGVGAGSSYRSRRALWLAQQLRQLRYIAGNPSRLIAREQLSGRAARFRPRKRCRQAAAPFASRTDHPRPQSVCGGSSSSLSLAVSIAIR